MRLIEMPPVLLIADDHELVRLGLRRLFTGSHLIREAATEAQAWRAALDPQVSVMVLDVRWTNAEESAVWDTGIGLLAAIRKARPQLPILMYSVESGADCIECCRGLGANGYLVKGVDDALLTLAVRAVLAGEEIWPDSVQPREPARPPVSETPRGGAPR